LSFDLIDHSFHSEKSQWLSEGKAFQIWSGLVVAVQRVNKIKFTGSNLFSGVVQPPVKKDLSHLITSEEGRYSAARSSEDVSEKIAQPPQLPCYRSVKKPMV
jgi:hypothetical protein